MLNNVIRLSVDLPPFLRGAAPIEIYLQQVFFEEFPDRDQRTLNLRLGHVLHLQNLGDDLHVPIFLRLVLELQA